MATLVGLTVLSPQGWNHQHREILQQTMRRMMPTFVCICSRLLRYQMSRKP